MVLVEHVQEGGRTSEKPRATSFTSFGLEATCHWLEVTMQRSCSGVLPSIFNLSFILIQILILRQGGQGEVLLSPFCR